MVALTTSMAWAGWVMGIRRYGVGWVHGGVCEQASPWQMGPRSILQGVVPPYGKPPAPDEEQNSRSSCLCLCHLRLQAAELKPPPPPNNNHPAPEALCCPLPHLLRLETAYIPTAGTACFLYTDILKGNNKPHWLWIFRQPCWLITAVFIRAHWHLQTYW